MTLLNGLLAFGASAFAIPLIIHLIHQTRYQIVDWGAMHLLRSSQDHNSRRLQWQQLLLLFFRCAIPILLAMAMARPLFMSFLVSESKSSMSIAIIVDDSMSMFVLDPKQPKKNSTRFSVACQFAAEILDRLPAGSNAMVLLGGAKPETISGQMPAELALRLNEVSDRAVPAGDLDWQESIRSSLEWLATSSHSKRQLVLIPDFQKHEWENSMSFQIPETKKLIASQSIAPALAFIKVSPSDAGAQSTTTTNLSIDSLETSVGSLHVGCECWISAAIRNNGITKCDGVRVAMFVNDIEIDRQELSVAAASTNLLRCRWSPNLPGDCVIRAQILVEDELRADNNLSSVAVVSEPIPILLVDGDRRSETMKSETDFLRLALSPFSLLVGKRGDAFLSKTIQPNELSESILTRYQTVCLCNVPEVSDIQQKWLFDYVERGNGLVVFLGDKVSTEQYQTWNSHAKQGLRIANFASRTQIKSDLSGASGNIKMQGIDFLPIRDLSSVSLASLAGVRFEHRIPFELDPTAFSGASQAWVAMRFEDNRAWILESRIGRGRCLWIGSACDDNDSNLPARPVFVPLVQKIVSYVCNSEPGRSNNLMAGDAWNTRIDASSTAANGLAIKQMRISKPDGEVVEVPLFEKGQMRFSDTRLLGAYIANPAEKVPIASIDRGMHNQSLPQFVACVQSRDRRSGQESQLAYLTAAEWSKMSETFNAKYSTSAAEFLGKLRSDWHGREVWTWVWSALVVVFVAEMAIEQGLSPRTRSRATSVAEKIHGKIV